MPPLPNARHEMVAQLVAQGTTKTEAYAAAGYEPDRHNASRLTTKDTVQQRVAEIQAGAVQSAQVTIASLVSAADEIRGLAVRDKQYSAAVGAVKEMGILSGVRIDRREVGSPGEFDRLSDAELMKLIEGSVELVELPDDPFATGSCRERTCRP